MLKHIPRKSSENEGALLIILRNRCLTSKHPERVVAFSSDRCNPSSVESNADWVHPKGDEIREPGSGSEKRAEWRNRVSPECMMLWSSPITAVNHQSCQRF